MYTLCSACVESRCEFAGKSLEREQKYRRKDKLSNKYSYNSLRYWPIASKRTPSLTHTCEVQLMEFQENQWNRM
jgi:hypothetical protein